MASPPRFLVVLPVRNGVAYVGDAVRSVLAQSERDLELLVLDNHSDDGTLEAVRAAADARVTVQGSDVALPIEASWARIAEALRHRPPETLVTLLGHDDLLYPAFLSTIDRLARAHPRAALLQTHFHLIDAQGKIERPCTPIPETESVAEYFRIRCWGCRDSFGTGLAFRAGDYLKVGGIPPFPRLLFADDALVVRLSELSYKAASPEIACAYRLHAGSASGAVTLSKNLDLLAGLDRWEAELRERHPALLAEELGRTAFGMLLCRVAVNHRMGFAERFLAPEQRALMRRIAERAAAYGQPVPPPPRGLRARYVLGRRGLRLILRDRKERRRRAGSLTV